MLSKYLVDCCHMLVVLYNSQHCEGYGQIMANTLLILLALLKVIFTSFPNFEKYEFVM